MVYIIDHIYVKILPNTEGLEWWAV